MGNWCCMIDVAFRLTFCSQFFLSPLLSQVHSAGALLFVRQLALDPSSDLGLGDGTTDDWLLRPPPDGLSPLRPLGRERERERKRKGKRGRKEERKAHRSIYSPPSSLHLSHSALQSVSACPYILREALSPSGRWRHSLQVGSSDSRNLFATAPFILEEVFPVRIPHYIYTAALLSVQPCCLWVTFLILNYSVSCLLGSY